MTAETKKILITGALGQIGTELTKRLREQHDSETIIASDIKEPQSSASEAGPYEIIDVTDAEALVNVIRKYGINTIYHMAAILSATGEKKPQLAWDVNMNGTHNILEIARELDLDRIFIPSSIAVFGPETPQDNTPQDTVLLPKTIYGVTKVAGELLAEYYVKRFNLDVRGCRYPGIISHETLPGGGTTDYAVSIFYEAVKHRKYTCFLKEDTRLPMMYMPDCLKATLDLMEAAADRLFHFAGFNISAMSFTPAELAAEIKKHIPDFSISYEPDSRQDIADTWPKTIDDSAARKEWGWTPDYDLESMTEDMIKILSKRHSEGRLNG
ncbi:L-threonine 3-dehydrogenase [Acidobacteriota bacterium]